jgi:CHU_C Type IX secretion signal domain/Lamin Tail Domain
MRRHCYLVLSLIFFCFLRQDISAQLVINEVMINAGNCDGGCVPNTGEWTELYNNSASPIDVSCYVLTDGDWSATFPPGTIISPFDFFVIGSNNSLAVVDLNIGTCNCTTVGAFGDGSIGVFTNAGGEQLVIADNTGNILDGIYWSGGQFNQTPSITTNTVLGCPSTNITLSASNPQMTILSGYGSDETTVALDCDGSSNWIVGVSAYSPGASNSNLIVFNDNHSIASQTCTNLGSITLNPTGGVGPFSFEWQGTLLGNNTNAASGLTAGTYTVEITDQGQCAPPVLFNIDVPFIGTPSLALNTTNSIICYGQSVTLTATGGNNYTWDSSPDLNTTTGNSVVATPTATSTYTVHSINNGCNETQSITIQVNYPPNTTPSCNNPLCEGDQLTLSSNTTTGTASWSGPNGFNSSVLDPTINNVTQSQAGTYTLTLTENNCSAAFTLPVSIDTPTIVTINPAGPFCPGDAPIDLNASAEPGVWSGPGITNTNTGMFDPSFGNVGNNNIVFQSNSYCTAPANAVVVINSNGDASIDPIGNPCETTPPFELQTVTTGGAWSGNGVSNTGIVSPGILGPGNYQAIYTLAGGCGATETLNFVVNATPQPTMSVSESAVCIPAEVELNANNAMSTWQCQWWVDGVMIGTDCNNQSFSVEETNCQDVQLMVTDGMGCYGSNIENNLFCGQSPPVAAFAVDPEQPFATDNEMNYIDLSSGAVQIEWEIDGILFNTSQVTYPINGTEGTLQSCLTAINALGCENKVCRIITIMDDYGVYVPTAFTPNEDGYNDGFGPVLYNLKGEDLNYSFSIFSRDGERVFQSENPKQKWHGNKEGGDIYVLQDSYVWVLKMNMPGEGEQKVFRGDVKILR